MQGNYHVSTKSKIIDVRQSKYSITGAAPIKHSERGKQSVSHLPSFSLALICAQCSEESPFLLVESFQEASLHAHHKT